MTRATLRLFAIVFVATVVLAGCASSAERPVAGTGPILTQEDMASVSASNLYEVVERLRPRWLQVRGPMSLTGTGTPQIVVFLNNSYLGGPDQLRQFLPKDVLDVRYLDGPTAAATMRGYDSTTHVAGAIVLRTANRD
jgi:hypothetical protein